MLSAPSQGSCCLHPLCSHRVLKACVYNRCSFCFNALCHRNSADLRGSLSAAAPLCPARTVAAGGGLCGRVPGGVPAHPTALTALCFAPTHAVWRHPGAWKGSHWLAALCGHTGVSRGAGWCFGVHVCAKAKVLVHTLQSFWNTPVESKYCLLFPAETQA